MSTTAPTPATTPIPVQLSEPEFEAFILPHLSMPKRGPKCKLGYYRVFNLILLVLYTGMQWKCLPVPHDAQGKPAIHYTTVYKVFARWADDGSLWQAFVASVRHLATEKQLDISVLHGDGTNTVAKKGAMASAIPATSTRRARKSSPSSTIMATSSRLSLWLLSMRPT
jgi:transposase